MAVGVQYALFIRDSKYQTKAEKVIVWVIFAYLVFIPLSLTVFLWRDRHRLGADIKVESIYF